MCYTLIVKSKGGILEMMNYYSVKEELYFNGEKIGEQYGHTMKDEEPEFDTELYSGTDLLQSIKDTEHFPEKLRGLATWEARLFHHNQYVLRAWGIGFNGISRNLNKNDVIVYIIKYTKENPSIEKNLAIFGWYESHSMAKR